MGGTKPELAGDRGQRGSEQGKIRRVEHDAEKREDEKAPVPARKRQLLQPCNQLSRFCLVRDSHAFPPLKFTGSRLAVKCRDAPCMDGARDARGI